MSDEIEKTLTDWLADAKRVVVAGVGNPIRSDDYVGLKIAENLEGKVPPNVCVLQCETVPESYIGDIEAFAPSHVLLVDAALLGLDAGEATLVSAEQVAGVPAFTTHMLPLRIFCETVKQLTGAKVGLLLIQPKSVEFGECLSREVSSAADKVTRVLLGLFR